MKKRGIYIIYLHVFTGYEDDLARLLSPKTADISRGKAEGNSCCRGGQLTSYRPNNLYIGILLYRRKIYFAAMQNFLMIKCYRTLNLM